MEHLYEPLLPAAVLDMSFSWLVIDEKQFEIAGPTLLGQNANISATSTATNAMIAPYSVIA